MAVHLVRSEASPTGYQEQPGATPDRGMIPWAVTTDGRVVWSNPDPPPGPPQARTGLLAYSKPIERERRALAETALAWMVLANPQYVADVLYAVSQGIFDYWQTRRAQLGGLPADWATTQHRKYVYGDNSFGRLGTSAEVPNQLDLEVRSQIAALFDNSVPRTLNVHDNFLRLFKVLGPTDLRPGSRQRLWKNFGLTKVEQDIVVSRWRRDSPQWQEMERVGEMVRPQALFDPQLRGRNKVTPEPGASTVAGIIPQGQTQLDMQACMRRLHLQPMENRRRGVDLHTPDLSASTAFLDRLQQHNLNFGAGPSGSTGSLFVSAILFGKLQEVEALKRYLLAIVVYLVGGGMHTCHEVFTTASFLGIPYDIGKYARTMPENFRRSALYASWQVEFWEIAAPDA